MVALAIFPGLAPFVPEPHLWEKLKTLFAGTPIRPIGIFYLFWHAWPPVLLALKLARMAQLRKAGWAGGAATAQRPPEGISICAEVPWNWINNWNTWGSGSGWWRAWWIRC